MARARICAVGGSGVGLSFRIPRRALAGETLVSDGLDYVNGGKAANQAIGAARLGIESRIITAVGHDPMGDLATRVLRDGGVNLEGVIVSDDLPTMVGALTIEPNGENSIIIAPGALARMDAEAVRARSALIESSTLCLVSLEIPTNAAHEALRVARESKTLAILNPRPPAILPRSSRS